MNSDPVLTEERVEHLRLILEKQKRRPVSTNEAFEIGRALIRFFDNLTSDSRDTSQNSGKKP